MFGGTVIHGDGLGKEYGFPTANLDLGKGRLFLQPGVYAGYAYVDKKKFKAALAYRENPKKVEIYIFDFTEDLYGRYLEFDPIQKVSEMERFDNTGEVIQKIKSDLFLIKQILN